MHTNVYPFLDTISSYNLGCTSKEMISWILTNIRIYWFREAINIISSLTIYEKRSRGSGRSYYHTFIHKIVSRDIHLLWNHFKNIYLTDNVSSKKNIFDARDRNNIWHTCKVISIHNKTAHVRFNGWSLKSEEYIPVNKLYPAGTKGFLHGKQIQPNQYCIYNHRSRIDLLSCGRTKPLSLFQTYKTVRVFTDGKRNLVQIQSMSFKPLNKKENYIVDEKQLLPLTDESAIFLLLKNMINEPMLCNENKQIANCVNNSFNYRIQFWRKKLRRNTIHPWLGKIFDEKHFCKKIGKTFTQDPHIKKIIKPKFKKNTFEINIEFQHCILSWLSDNDILDTVSRISWACLSSSVKYVKHRWYKKIQSALHNLEPCKKKLGRTHKEHINQLLTVNNYPWIKNLGKWGMLRNIWMFYNTSNTQSQKEFSVYNVSVNDRVDVKDRYNRWGSATVKSVTNLKDCPHKHIKVNFDGWSKKQSETICCRYSFSCRISTFGTKSFNIFNTPQKNQYCIRLYENEYPVIIYILNVMFSKEDETYLIDGEMLNDYKKTQFIYRGYGLYEMSDELMVLMFGKEFK